MSGLELMKRNTAKRTLKKRATKIDEYNLSNKVVNYLADNKSYVYIAKQLTQYVRKRKINPDPSFTINQQTIKTWWMENVNEFGPAMNEKRNALVSQRHRMYLDKGVKIREEIQDKLKKDADKAYNLAKDSFGVEAAARIREKIVKVQESGEKAVSDQSPNLTVTNIIVNPLTEFAEKMKNQLEEQEEEDANTVDIEYEDIEVEEDDDEGGNETTEGAKKKKKEQL